MKKPRYRSRVRSAHPNQIPGPWDSLDISCTRIHQPYSTKSIGFCLVDLVLKDPHWISFQNGAIFHGPDSEKMIFGNDLYAFRGKGLDSFRESPDFSDTISDWATAVQQSTPEPFVQSRKKCWVPASFSHPPSPVFEGDSEKFKDAYDLWVRSMDEFLVSALGTTPIGYGPFRSGIILSLDRSYVIDARRRGLKIDKSSGGMRLIVDFTRL